MSMLNRYEDYVRRILSDRSMSIKDKDRLLQRIGILLGDYTDLFVASKVSILSVLTPFSLITT